MLTTPIHCLAELLSLSKFIYKALIPIEHFYVVLTFICIQRLFIQKRKEATLISNLFVVLNANILFIFIFLRISFMIVNVDST